MKTVKIKKLCEDAIMPDYAHKGDAGLDLYAIKDEVINPFEYKLVGTGLAIELPEGTEAQVRSKSGIALEYAYAALFSLWQYLLLYYRFSSMNISLILCSVPALSTAVMETRYVPADIS